MGREEEGVDHVEMNLFFWFLGFARFGEHTHVTHNWTTLSSTTFATPLLFLDKENTIDPPEKENTTTGPNSHLQHSQRRHASPFHRNELCQVEIHRVNDTK